MEQVDDPGREQLFFNLGDEGNVQRAAGSTLDGYLLGWSGTASVPFMLRRLGVRSRGGTLFGAV